MNSQEKKAWLRQCAALDRDIDRLILERSRWMARATRMVPTPSDMPRGGGERRSSEDIILRIAEIENEIDRKIDALLDQRAAVVEAITAVATGSFGKYSNCGIWTGRRLRRSPKRWGFPSGTCCGCTGQHSKKFPSMSPNVIECHVFEC